MAGSLRIGSLFISGANRGIGLEFVKQLTQLPEPPKHIFATCRNPDAAQELKDLAAKNPNVHIHKLDVLDFVSYPSVAQWVEQMVGSAGLNVLISNAGLGHMQGTLHNVTHDTMVQAFETNTVAPLMLAKTFLPLLKKAARAAGGAGMNCSRAAIINITTRMGSISDNTSGTKYEYRSSKAALNMITKSLSVDLKPEGILAVVLHPGWVLTEMGGPDALVTASTSVSGLLKVMEGLNDDSAGQLISFKGEVIPW